MEFRIPDVLLLLQLLFMLQTGIEISIAVYPRVNSVCFDGL